MLKRYWRGWQGSVGKSPDEGRDTVRGLRIHSASLSQIAIGAGAPSTIQHQQYSWVIVSTIGNKCLLKIQKEPIQLILHWGWPPFQCVVSKRLSLEAARWRFYILMFIILLVIFCNKNKVHSLNNPWRAIKTREEVAILWPHRLGEQLSVGLRLLNKHLRGGIPSAGPFKGSEFVRGIFAIANPWIVPLCSDNQLWSFHSLELRPSFNGAHHRWHHW